MLRTGLLITCLITAALGQISFYATRVSHSGLLPQFRKSTPDPLANRDGVENEPTTTTTELPKELKGTLQDNRLVNRVSQWPEDKQPFWYKNRKVIQSQREQSVDNFLKNKNNTPSRSPFAGQGR